MIILKNYTFQGGNEVTRKNPLDMPTMLSGGMSGRIWPDDNDKIKPVGEQIKAPLANCEDVINNQVICVKYRDLSFDDDYIFKAKLLENVIIPQATLKPRDYDQMTPYRPNLGFAQRPQYQRDFAPAQRYIRHAMGSQQSYQQQSYQQQSYQQERNQPGGSFPERQQGGYYPQRQPDGHFSQRPPNGNYRQRQPGGYYRPRHQNQYNSYRPNY